MTAPTLTPNVRIESPRARKIIGNVLGWAGVAVTATTIVDAAVEQADWSFITDPAAAIVVGLFGLYQLLVTSPNVATPGEPGAACVAPTEDSSPGATNDPDPAVSQGRGRSGSQVRASCRT